MIRRVCLIVWLLGAMQLAMGVSLVKRDLVFQAKDIQAITVQATPLKNVSFPIFTATLRLVPTAAKQLKTISAAHVGRRLNFSVGYVTVRGVIIQMPLSKSFQMVGLNQSEAKQLKRFMLLR